MGAPEITRLTTHREIGEFLTVDANEGQTIRAICEHGEIKGDILETPNDYPTQDHQYFEVTIADEIHPDSYGGVLCIQIQSVDEWGINSYCFGQEYINKEYEQEDRGEIQTVLVFD